jgi:Reverse transcriptase (RNA-dependent DNA polymerase)
MDRHELTAAKIAEVMGVKQPELVYLAVHSEDSFLPTEPRKNEKGKIREIDPPKQTHKRLFRRLHRFWQHEFPPPAMAHGGVRGRSHYTSARLHLGRKFVVSRDISNCYNSIKTEPLCDVLRKSGFTPEVAWLLSRLFTVHGRVPQGSPLSGDALNEYLRFSDHVIASTAGRLGVGRSRLSDDIVLSFDDANHIGLAGDLIEQQIRSVGLEVNANKRASKGTQPAHLPQDLHGLIVNSKRGTRVNPEYWKEAVSRANRYRELAKQVDETSLASLAAHRSIAVGHMQNCRQAESSPAKELRRQIDAGDRHVRRKLVRIGLAQYRNNWWVSRLRCTPGYVALQWRSRTVKGVFNSAAATPLGGRNPARKWNDLRVRVPD